MPIIHSIMSSMMKTMAIYLWAISVHLLCDRIQGLILSLSNVIRKIARDMNEDSEEPDEHIAHLSSISVFYLMTRHFLTHILVQISRLLFIYRIFFHSHPAESSMEARWANWYISMVTCNFCFILYSSMRDAPTVLGTMGRAQCTARRFLTDNENYGPFCGVCLDSQITFE